MPYKLEKRGDKYHVINSDTGADKGASDTREMAIKHMRALYVNESKDILKALENIDELEATESEIETVAKSILESVKGLFGLNKDDKLTIPQTISYVKQSDGRTRVFMRMSNNFKDRHGEIITEAAHKEYEAYVAQSQDYPEFWLWHTPGSRWGKADLVSFDDGFLTVSGLVDTGKEYIAESLAKLEDVGVSHGFRGISVQGKGYIDFYRTFEASPLPRSEAANVWTAYMIAKSWENGMALAEKHRNFFSALHIPDSVIAEWDKENKDLTSILKEAGIEYKAVEEPEPEPTPKPEPKPEEPEPSPTISDVIKAIKTLSDEIGTVKTKQIELESKVGGKDILADAMQAALVPGAGFTASKEGNAPSDSIKKETDEWLLNLITGVPTNA